MVGLRSKVATIILILALSIYAHCPALAQQCHPIHGITFTHYRVDSKAVCMNGRDSAHVLAEGAIIPQYADPAVRHIVQQDLVAAKAAGFGMIRTVIWFTQDKIMAPWGQIPAPLQPQDGSNILNFGKDIRAAGFEKWMVVMGPGIRNGPACKKVTWGDCWDPSRLNSNIAFVHQIYDLLKPLGTPGFQVEYDVSGEMCPSRYLPAQANQNIDGYITALIKAFHSFAPEAKFHVSCGGFGDDRLALMMQLFKSAGVTPNAVDIHFYDTDPAIIAKKLLPAAKLAEENHLPLEIGEMEYENAQEAQAIGALARQNKICFSELIEWPLHGNSKCQINVNPPFSDQITKSGIGQ